MSCLSLLPEYTCDNMLGKGSFGETFLYTKKTNNKKYAVKIIPFGKYGISGIESEIKILEKIRKNICSKYVLCLKKTVVLDNNLFLITDYNNGYTLDRYMKHFSQSSPKVLLLLFRQLLSGLLYLHKLDISHQDIKGPNILINDTFIKSIKSGKINSSCNAMLIDLGLSCYTTKCQLSGTPQYQSPLFASAILSGKYDISINDSKKNDIYSLGYMFYMAANKGKDPYNEDETDKLSTSKFYEYIIKNKPIVSNYNTSKNKNVNQYINLLINSMLVNYNKIKINKLLSFISKIFKMENK